MARDIWWADVIRAHTAVGGRPEQFAAVARVLGLDVRPNSPPSEPVTLPTPDSIGAAGRRTSEPADQESDAVDDRPGSAATAVPVLEPVGREPLTTMLTDGRVLARPTDARQAPPMPLQPLLTPRSTNAVLQFLLSRMVDDGPPDLPALIEALAASRPVSAMPRLPQRTLRFGTEVLADLGDAMRPFRRDQAQVVHSVRAVVGSAATRVRYFADAPLRGAGTGPRFGWPPYRPPAAGSQVLLLTDFGIGGDELALDRASIGEWLEFLDVLRRARCQPVALVPYPPARWPAELRTHCPMLMWDRTTTVGHARTVRS